MIMKSQMATARACFTVLLLICWALLAWGARPVAVPLSVTNVEKKSLPDGWRWDEYHNYDESVRFLKMIDAGYDHVQLRSIGRSVQNRDLWVVDLAGPVAKGSKVHRPIVKLVGNMHGDEVANFELLLRLIHHLAASYGQDKRITQLLQTVRVMLLPSMNPDGLVAGQRVNANGKDLNRNFPLDGAPYKRPGPPSADDSVRVAIWRELGAGPLQPEVQAVMKWTREHPITLSANFHGGALVANYPFDVCDTQGTVQDCPTSADPLPLFLAQIYAQNHATMRLNDAKGFVNGTTRGSQWYTILGGMQDWVFYNTNGMELTLEVHEDKYPPAETLSAMWQLNLPALLRLLEMAASGLHLRLVDKQTLKPLAGSVQVTSPGGTRSYTIPTESNGEIFLLLVPDVQYTLTVNPKDPSNCWNYKVIKKQVLLPGRQKFIQGKGVQGLARDEVILAERSTKQGVKAQGTGTSRCAATSETGRAEAKKVP